MTINCAFLEWSVFGNWNIDLYKKKNSDQNMQQKLQLEKLP